jgi:hypothetical protein
MPAVCTADYLPISGPADLRFLPKQVPAEVKPPPMPLPPPKEESVESTAAPTNVLTNTPEDIVMTAKSPDPINYQNFSSNPEYLVTPQMMVPYFQGTPNGSNSLPSNPGSPLWFKPPMPNGPVSKLPKS